MLRNIQCQPNVCTSLDTFLTTQDVRTLIACRVAILGACATYTLITC